MSRPIEICGQSIFPLRTLSGGNGTERFAEYYNRPPHEEVFASVSQKAKEHGLRFSNGELKLFSLLDTAEELDHFLATQIGYNFDHTSIDDTETAKSPKQVLQTGTAHCFEAATLAYAVHFLHGRDPKLAVLEAQKDAQHNLVIFEDPITGRMGASAHSGYPGLAGRPAVYKNLHSLAESYRPFYYSNRSNNSRDLTLVGYSDPFDLVKKYGYSWMDSEVELWNIYHTYIDSSVKFHYLDDPDGKTHLYPLISDLICGYIQIGPDNKPYVDMNYLPKEAKLLWKQYWDKYDSGNSDKILEEMVKIEKEFFRLTGTTPVDLTDDAIDLEDFLHAGYAPKDLIKSWPTG